MYFPGGPQETVEVLTCGQRVRRTSERVPAKPALVCARQRIKGEKPVPGSALRKSKNRQLAYRFSGLRTAFAGRKPGLWPA